MKDQAKILVVKFFIALKISQCSFLIMYRLFGTLVTCIRRTESIFSIFTEILFQPSALCFLYFAPYNLALLCNIPFLDIFTFFSEQPSFQNHALFFFLTLSS